MDQAASEHLQLQSENSGQSGSSKDCDRRRVVAATELRGGDTLKVAARKTKKGVRLCATKRQCDRRVAHSGVDKNVKAKEKKSRVKERAESKLPEGLYSKFEMGADHVVKGDRFMASAGITETATLSGPSSVMTNAAIICVFTPSNAGYRPPFLGDMDDSFREPVFDRRMAVYGGVIDSSQPQGLFPDASSQAIDFDISELFVNDSEDLQKAVAQLGVPMSHHIYLIMSLEEKWGRDDARTLDHLSKFCVILTGQGRYCAAQMVFQRVLSDKLWELGIQHPDTMVALCSMASLVRAQGKYEVALGTASYVELNSDSDGLLWLKASALSLKSRALVNCGRWVEAEHCARLCWAARIQSAGQSSRQSETILAANELADILLTVKKYDEVVELATEILEEASTCDDDQQILECRRILTRALMLNGKFTEAEKSLREIAAKAEALYGSESAISLRILSDLGDSLTVQKDFVGAEGTLSQVYRRSLKFWDCDSLNTLGIIERLAFAIRMQNDMEKATTMEFMLRAALSSSRSSHGPTHPIREELLVQWSLILSSLSRFEEAKGACQELVNLRSEILGLEHPRTEEAFQWLQICEQQSQPWNDWICQYSGWSSGVDH